MTMTQPRLQPAVLGLGYVGLPLLAEASAAGLRPIGFDISAAVVDGLNAGRSHIDDLSDERIQEMRSGGFRATHDPADLAEANVYVICVPTPLSEAGGPDLDAVIAATRTVAGVLGSGDLVILESTTYPGTTEEVLVPILAESGLTLGSDYLLAFSPERIDPGNPTYGFRNTPKVVGGVDGPSTDAAAAFYANICDTVVKAKGTREAEMAKLLENTYRHVNIALVNEMAAFCHEMDLDLWDAIRCAATKPFGFQAFYPGPGVGGHCIPIDPNYLSHHVRNRLGQSFRFVELAQEINQSMPRYVARRVQDQLNDQAKAVRGARILLLGVTYKANIADQRESPARPLADALLGMGADLHYWDPRVERWDVGGRDIPRVDELAGPGDADFDLVVLLQHHNEIDPVILAAWGDQVFDTRGVLETGHSL